MTSPAQIGSYRVERLLGTGSFATVWLGFDPSLGARVAIKVLADNWSHDLRIRERFLDEARLLWRLDHHRIVRVYALGELDDGRPYLVMAWADRGSLRDRLAAGPVPVHSGLGLLQEIAAGVAVLHGHAIVHRDLSPGNVLFRSRPGGAGAATGEQVVIADLGLAKALAAASGLTARAGTPGYMAPEQDEPFAVVDQRADVYSLGRLGIRLLGKPTTARSGPEVDLRPGVPAKVVGVLRTATAHRPTDRYPDAAAFGAALSRATGAAGAGNTGGQDPFGGDLHGADRSQARARPWRRAATAGAAAAALLVLASDSVTGRPAAVPGAAVDPTGRITIALPPGWHAAGSGWVGHRDAGGSLDPAIVVSPDPGRWTSDPSVPGAFVGLSRTIGEQATPAEFVARQGDPVCVAEPARTTRRAGIDWVVARQSCPAGKPVKVEAAGVGPNGAGLVYVQVAPPAGTGDEFVDTLLAGVRVR